MRRRLPFVLKALPVAGIALLVASTNPFAAQSGTADARGGEARGSTRTALPGPGPAAAVTLRGVVTGREPVGSNLLVELDPIHPASPDAARPYGISTDASGRFAITGVPPGRYRLTVRRRSPPLDPGGDFAAVALINVDREDQDDLRLVLEPGGILEGRLFVDGAVPSPDLQARLLVGSEAQEHRDVTTGTPRGGVDREGRFILPYLLPGAHRLQVQDGSRGPMLTVVSQWVAGRETVHGGIDVPLGTTITGVVVHVTTRTHALIGRVGDPGRLGLAGTHVIVFPADASVWPVTTRIYAAHPGDDGRYRFANLPPGEYFVALATGLATDEWFDPAVLARLEPAAVRVQIENETTIVDLTRK